MKITVLGSGSAFSDLSRFNSCYCIETGGSRFLIDCGSDAMRAMQKSAVDFFSIGKIFITHMHADHAAGLPAVLTAMHVQRRKEPLEIFVPYTQLDFASSWLANMFIYRERLTFETSLVPLTAGRLGLNDDVGLEFYETRHLEKYSREAGARGIRPVSFSVVVREGKKSFLFSGDIESVAEVKAFLPGCSSFIESTHLPLDELAALSVDRVGDIYFTHVPMELEQTGEWRKELAERYGIGNFKSVRDGQTIVV